MMRILRLFGLCLLLALAGVGCKGGNAMSGRWRIEQDNNAFGEGAEKGELELKDDGTFNITMGQLSLAEGTWTSKENELTLSNGAQNFGADYQLKEGKLVPLVNGKEVTFWRFVKK